MVLAVRQYGGGNGDEKRKRGGIREVEDDSKRMITRYREEEVKEVVIEVGKVVQSG